MNTNLTLNRSHGLIAFVAATLASVIAIGILTAVTSLFLRSGTPMERLVLAERACIHYPYVSEREACMHQWLARSPSIANR